MTENSCQCKTDLHAEKHQAIHLLWIGLFVLGVMALALWVSPRFWIEDQSALYRYALLKFPQLLVDVFVLIASVVLFDFITPEDSLGCIYKDPLSTSILYSALIIGVSIAVAFG